MEEVKTMTVLDVLKETNKILSGIKVSVLDANTVGVPIANAVQNLNVVIEAMEENEKKEVEPDG